MDYFTYLKTRLEEALQFTALTHIFITFYLGPLLSLVFCAYIYFFTSLYPLLLAYTIWIYIDRNTCKRDGRRLSLLRNNGLWKYYRDYFPQKLVKTTDISSKGNYIFCFFPHGLVCSGAFSLAAWDDSHFYKEFPGMTITCHTLNINFYIPFSREYALGLGFVSVSRDALLYQLSKPGGHAVCLIVGGSAEAMLSQPATYQLVLKNRKGFVKLALNTGTPLVPVYVFGEVDLYDQVIYEKNSFKRKAQEFFRSLTGVAPCNIRGCGLLGLFPRSVPVTTVVGEPILVDKVDDPSAQQIDELHGIFITKLEELFETHKKYYIKNHETAHLQLH